MACSETSIYLLGPSILSGNSLKSPSASYNDQQERFELGVDFTAEGSQTWAQFTSVNIGRQAAFVIDSKIVSAPTIQGATPAGSPTSITGSFTEETASTLAATLNSGALPIRFTRSN